MKKGWSTWGVFVAGFAALAACSGTDANDAPSTGGGGGAPSSGGRGGAAAEGGHAGGGAGAAAHGGTGTGGAGAGGTGASGSAGSGGMLGDTTVRLIALGDTGEGNDGQRAVAAQMDAKCGSVGGCTAVLMLGDNFYDVGVRDTRDSQWISKFEMIYDLPNLNGLRFFATLGNHDYGLTSTGSKQAQIDYSGLPVGVAQGTRLSEKWTMPDSYYDVSLGDVHLFSIDTQDNGDAQRSDMGARVKNSNATWKIVFAHHPRFTSGDHAKDNPVLGWLGMYKTQAAVYCGADLFLTGHDHNMEYIAAGRDAACPNTHFAISGAGSKLRDAADGWLRGETGEGFQRFYDEEHLGFLYLEARERNLLMQFIDTTGQVLHEVRLAK